jgi:hypothetical protein
MATALQDPFAEAFAAIAATIDPAQNDHGRIPADYGGPAPVQVIVRDVGMIAQNALLDFFYTTPRPRGPLPPGGVQQVIDELLAAPAAAQALGAAPGRIAGFADTDFENPLDLNVDTTSIVIFRLSDLWQWTFDPTMGGVTTKVAQHAQAHGGLRFVADDGTPYDVPTSGCRIAYFIANPPDDFYFQGFNLEVLLKQSDGPFGIPRFMPITIDPDIRNPGGSIS